MSCDLIPNRGVSIKQGYTTIEMFNDRSHRFVFCMYELCEYVIHMCLRANNTSETNMFFFFCGSRHNYVIYVRSP